MTGGAGPLGSDRGDAPPTVLVLATAVPRPDAGTAVHVVPWVRNERSAVAGLKTTSYAENVVALARAHSRGASEALFANTRDELCEGTGQQRRGRARRRGGHAAAVVRLPRGDHPRAAARVGRRRRRGGLRAHGADGRAGACAGGAADVLHPGRAARAPVDDRRLEPGPVGAALGAVFRRHAGDDLDP